MNTNSSSIAPEGNIDNLFSSQMDWAYSWSDSFSTNISSSSSLISHLLPIGSLVFSFFWKQTLSSQVVLVVFFSSSHVVAFGVPHEFMNNMLVCQYKIKWNGRPSSPHWMLFVLEKSLQDASLLAGLTSQTPGEKVSNHSVNILLGKTFWIFSHHVS